MPIVKSNGRALAMRHQNEPFVPKARPAAAPATSKPMPTERAVNVRPDPIATVEKRPELSQRIAAGPEAQIAPPPDAAPKGRT